MKSKNSQPKILVTVNNSMSSRAVLAYISRLSLCRIDYHITLLHVFRDLPAGDRFVGDEFSNQEKPRLQNILMETKLQLVKSGFDSKKIYIEFLAESNPIISDGIIEHLKERKFDMVIIGRKRMSKAEEFVMDDISVKLIREMVGPAIMVVTSDH